MTRTKIIFFCISIFFLNVSTYAQTNYSNAVKEKKIYPVGEKIYKKMCSQNIDYEKYKSVQELKESIKSEKLCNPLSDKNLEILSIYLWDKKRVSTQKEHTYHIDVTKDEKCPVCGMFVYKYPKWATQIFYADKHYSFDGVKDMMKYYFEHKNGISKILVRDYYFQNAIDATTAFYVIGSDIYGPMGHELIPFAKESDATTFMLDHKADEVVRFEDITSKKVNALDE